MEPFTSSDGVADVGKDGFASSDVADPRARPLRTADGDAADDSESLDVPVDMGDSREVIASR